MNFTEKSKNANIEFKKPVIDTNKSNNINYGTIKSTINKELFQGKDIDDNENNKLNIDNIKNSQRPQSTAENLPVKTSTLRTSIRDSNAFTELPSNFIDLMQSDLKEFVFKPAPKGTTVKCTITRDKQGIDGGIHPAFYMYFEREDKKKV